jgi:hypothetical protein
MSPDHSEEAEAAMASSDHGSFNEGILERSKTTAQGEPTHIGMAGNAAKSSSSEGKYL